MIFTLITIYCLEPFSKLMENIPPFVSITFIVTVLATFGFLYYAINTASSDKTNTTPTMAITLIIAWVFVVSLLTFNGFFRDFDSQPPRFLYLILPPLLVIIALLAIPKSRAFLQKMPLTTLTYIHIIRVPVEMVLWWLSQEGVVASAMTFEGMNYDILSGISAPFAGVFLVGLRSKSKIGAFIWNLLAFGLVLNIVVRAISATPYFFDPAVYDQPNIAVFYFPYVLLPAFIVPAVFFSHLVSFYRLLTDKDEY